MEKDGALSDFPLVERGRIASDIISDRRGVDKESLRKLAKKYK